ncbi:hypothetical protein COU37_05580 [Candidatus Micrarchaeota archaeon CG10_big_fil_rev_8_21_14_0_10_45_29]|nr:MAG: hypothetical protein COU37_05580 [Candidatus Micrarchaeota archaeon CG10_big_fil_rev_8_21_14_0_10_45_29]
MATEFEKNVWGAAALIPSGCVATYYCIAQAIGNPKASRAVGNALHKSPGMPECPCHRVIKSNGKAGGFAFGAKKKLKMLEKEN